MLSFFARSAAAIVGGGFFVGVVGRVAGNTFEYREITRAATTAAAETCEVVPEATSKISETVVDAVADGVGTIVCCIAPEAAVAIGRAAAANVRAPSAEGLAAATTAGIEAGLDRETAVAGARAACSAAATKLSELTQLTPAVTVVSAAVGALAGYYVFNRFDTLETEIVNLETQIANNNANNEARFANIERMLNARAQTFIHNLDAMSHEALVDLLTCPISLDIITDPVYMNDNRFYERSEITRYFLGNKISPVNPGITLEDPINVPTHQQARSFLQANRERLLADPPQQEVNARITTSEKELKVLRNSSSAARQVGFMSNQTTAPQLPINSNLELSNEYVNLP